MPGDRKGAVRGSQTELLGSLNSMGASKLQELLKCVRPHTARLPVLASWIRSCTGSFSSLPRPEQLEALSSRLPPLGVDLGGEPLSQGSPALQGRLDRYLSGRHAIDRWKALQRMYERTTRDLIVPAPLPALSEDDLSRASEMTSRGHPVGEIRRSHVGEAFSPRVERPAARVLPVEATPSPKSKAGARRTAFSFWGSPGAKGSDRTPQRPTATGGGPGVPGGALPDIHPKRGSFGGIRSLATAPPEGGDKLPSITQRGGAAGSGANAGPNRRQVVVVHGGDSQQPRQGPYQAAKGPAAKPSR